MHPTTIPTPLTLTPSDTHPMYPTITCFTLVSCNVLDSGILVSSILDRAVVFQFVLVCLGTGVCLGGWECFVEFWGSSPVLLVDMSDSFYYFITTTCVWFLHWCSVVWVLKDKLIKKYKWASGRTAKWDWICCCTVRTWVLEFFFVNHFIKDLRFPIRTAFIHNKHSLIKVQCCYMFPSLFINVRCQTVLILIQYGGVFGL